MCVCVCARERENVGDTRRGKPFLPPSFLLSFLFAVSSASSLRAPPSRLRPCTVPTCAGRRRGGRGCRGGRCRRRRRCRRCRRGGRGGGVGACGAQAAQEQQKSGARELQRRHRGEQWRG